MSQLVSYNAPVNNDGELRFECAVPQGEYHALQ
jgi:hypothetical protein